MKEAKCMYVFCAQEREREREKEKERKKREKEREEYAQEHM